MKEPETLEEARFQIRDLREALKIAAQTATDAINKIARLKKRPPMACASCEDLNLDLAHKNDEIEYEVERMRPVYAAAKSWSIGQVFIGDPPVPYWSLLNAEMDDVLHENEELNVKNAALQNRVVELERALAARGQELRRIRDHLAAMVPMAKALAANVSCNCDFEQQGGEQWCPPEVAQRLRVRIEKASKVVVP